MKEKKAIVTGADGFIGRNIVKELLNNDYLVYAIVLNTVEAKAIIGNHAQLHYLECDMNHYKNLQKCDELQNIPMLFHFAWEGVSDNKSSDYMVQLNNARCSCELQTVASNLGIKRLVFASSIMEYEHIKAVEHEEYNLPLRNTYHIIKSTTRNLLQLRCSNMNMEFIPVIISNVYGIGENSPRLINTTIRNLLQGRHMSFTSGEQLYDFIYIDDAARAIRLSAENGKNNKIYYIGNKQQRPLKEFLYELRDAVAPNMNLGVGEIEFQGISLDYTEFDTCGIFEDFEFTPRFSFSEGIKMTSEWMRKIDGLSNDQ